MGDLGWDVKTECRSMMRQKVWKLMYFRHVCSVFVYGRGENLKCNACFYEQKLPLIYGKLAQIYGCGT